MCELPSREVATYLRELADRLDPTVAVTVHMKADDDPKQVANEVGWLLRQYPWS